ncbi:F-box only protein 28 isoform X2 [Nymphalis io]|uniref:F-box only protein 28 isoform X2 n=1 Tax=Inachis io TaxID=171585 RepID=UPI0021680ECE|nr:F-box only protein 28 isoform X2 [Nymphalis io]
MTLLSLPMLVVENIFSYLSYDEIAKLRLVSKPFNNISMRLLNRGFLMIERRHALALKNVKAQLPRRESERRYHPLARHCDILTSIETRISMLNMTYSKFIDNGICCFIPGKVIDEISRVLYIVEISKTPPRAHEVLQELRDISSMAIEHFDEKISPALRRKLQEGVAPPPPRPSPPAVIAPIALNHEIQALRRRSILNARLSLYLASQYKKFHKRMLSYKRIAALQQKQIRNYQKKQKQQDNCIAELKRRIEECDIKYSELTHTNQAVGGKGTQPLRHFGSQIKLDLSVLPIGTSKMNQNILLPNIKPRNPSIKLPSLSEDRERRSDQNPGPSTSNQSPKGKVLSTMAKIRGLTNEIRNLTNISKSIEGRLKRPLRTEDEEVLSKKLKQD